MVVLENCSWSPSISAHPGRCVLSRAKLPAASWVRVKLHHFHGRGWRRSEIMNQLLSPKKQKDETHTTWTKSIQVRHPFVVFDDMIYNLKLFRSYICVLQTYFVRGLPTTQMSSTAMNLAGVPRCCQCWSSFQICMTIACTYTIAYDIYDIYAYIICFPWNLYSCSIACLRWEVIRLDVWYFQVCFKAKSNRALLKSTQGPGQFNSVPFSIFQLASVFVQDQINHLYLF